MAVDGHLGTAAILEWRCCRSWPLRQLGFLVVLVVTGWNRRLLDLSQNPSRRRCGFDMARARSEWKKWSFYICDDERERSLYSWWEIGVGRLTWIDRLAQLRSTKCTRLWTIPISVRHLYVIRALTDILVPIHRRHKRHIIPADTSSIHRAAPLAPMIAGSAAPERH